MKLNPSIFSSSAFSASKAYIEKHEAAIFKRALGLSVCFRSSPSNVLMFSMSSIRYPLSPYFYQKSFNEPVLSGFRTYFFDCLFRSLYFVLRLRLSEVLLAAVEIGRAHV